MPKSVSTPDMKDVLERGVSQLIDRKELESMLLSGKKLRIKLGIDPTAPDLHLGHAVLLRKLRDFQKLGHKIVLIIGDFTGQVGDPSGKSKTRPPLTEAEVKKNMKSYLSQAGKVINVKKTEVQFNSKWHKKLNGAKLLGLLSLMSVQQMLEREDFAKRLEAKESIRLHELLYPFMQAYDSVMVKADVEIGGNDQLFNLLAGRDLMSRLGMKPQQVLTTSLLLGLDGVNKMSKSLGNYVSLNDKPNDMFGKIMSLPDRELREYFELCTDMSAVEIEAVLGGSPRDAKARLAREVVRLYHGEREAAKAEDFFTRTFVKKDMTQAEFPELHVSMSEVGIADLPVASGIAKSRSEAWRLVEQGAVSVNDKTLKNPREKVSLKTGDVLKIGKKNFFRIKLG